MKIFLVIGGSFFSSVITIGLTRKPFISIRIIMDFFHANYSWWVHKKLSTCVLTRLLSEDVLCHEKEVMEEDNFVKEKMWAEK